VTPTEIIADRINGVCIGDPVDVAAAIVSRLEHEGWEIRCKAVTAVEWAGLLGFDRPRHGDRWEGRNGRAVVVASSDWPPPQPGTHESELYRSGLVTDMSDEIFPSNYAQARRWSRDNRHNNPERNPQ